MFNSTVAAFHNMEAITVNPMFKNSSFVFCIESFKGNLNCICTKPQCRQLNLGVYTRSTFILNSILGGGQVNSDLIIPAEMDLQKTKTKCIHIEDSEMEGFDSHK